MRVNLTFILLLLTASTATSLVWRNFVIARDGDPIARVVVLVGAPVALLCLTLLGRIIAKVRSDVARQERCATK